MSILLNSTLGGSVTAILAQQLVRKGVVYAAWALNNIYIPPQIYIAGVPVTTRFQEAYRYDSEITEQTTESGSIISDHVILRPLRIDIHCEVGNWYPGWAEYSLNLLEGMWKARALLTLLTTHKSIPNMILRGFHADNEAPTWGRLMFELNFQQIPQVVLKTTQYDKDTTSSDVSKSAGFGMEPGKVTTTPITETDLFS